MASPYEESWAARWKSLSKSVQEIFEFSNVQQSELWKLGESEREWKQEFTIDWRSKPGVTQVRCELTIQVASGKRQVSAPHTYLRQQRKDPTLCVHSRRHSVYDRWLANCYFAHSSLRFPVQLPFVNASFRRPFHPLTRHPDPVAPTWRRPFPYCRVPSAQTPAPLQKLLT